MNNLDKIIDKINSETSDKAYRIVEDAKAEGRKRVEEANFKAEDIIKLANKRAETEAAAIEQRAYSQTQISERELLLEAKVSLINKAYERAGKIILNMHPEDYCTLFAHLLCDAVTERLDTVKKLIEEYGDEEEHSTDFVVIFNDKDRIGMSSNIVKMSRTLLKGVSDEYGKTPITVSAETAEISGGFILRYGDIETNCSIEAVISDSREGTESTVRKILFNN